MLLLLCCQAETSSFLLELKTFDLSIAIIVLANVVENIYVRCYVPLILDNNLFCLLVAFNPYFCTACHSYLMHLLAIYVRSYIYGSHVTSSMVLSPIKENCTGTFIFGNAKLYLLSFLNNNE